MGAVMVTRAQIVYLLHKNVLVLSYAWESKPTLQELNEHDFEISNKLSCLKKLENPIILKGKDIWCHMSLKIDWCLIPEFILGG